MNRKPRVVLEDAQWHEIAMRVASGESQTDIALEFGISQSTITRVLKGENRPGLWSWIVNAVCACGCGAPFVASVASQKFATKECFLRHRREKYRDGVRSGTNKQNGKRELVRAAKDKPCADCGVYYPGEPYLMDLDHREPESKNHSLRFTKGKSRKGLYSLSYAELQEEIGKCDVVCCVCHRRRTQRQVAARSLDLRKWKRVGGKRRKASATLPLFAAVAAAVDVQYPKSRHSARTQGADNVRDFVAP